MSHSVGLLLGCLIFIVCGGLLGACLALFVRLLFAFDGARLGVSADDAQRIFVDLAKQSARNVKRAL